MLRKFLAVLILLLAVPVNAQNKEPRIISRSRAVFDNINCTVTHTCDLKQIRYVVEDYEILVDGGHSYGTRLFAWYTTDILDTLENYVFVQVIKGCQYYSSKLDNNIGGVARDHFSERVIFNHKDWVIDSIDTDPVYFSTPKSRHFNYKWNTKPGSTNNKTEKIYGLEKPNRPELYISDRPGTAFYMNGNAKNISLAFKICLYKTLDVPKTTSPDNVDFGIPIHCFYWYSSWVYNHQNNKFEGPYSISPVCNQ